LNNIDKDIFTTVKRMVQCVIVLLMLWVVGVGRVGHRVSPVGRFYEVSLKLALAIASAEKQPWVS
jgi:hypothetical protein